MLAFNFLLKCMLCWSFSLWGILSMCISEHTEIRAEWQVRGAYSQTHSGLWIELQRNKIYTFLNMGPSNIYLSSQNWISLFTPLAHFLACKIVYNNSWFLPSATLCMHRQNNKNTNSEHDCWAASRITYPATQHLPIDYTPLYFILFNFPILLPPRCRSTVLETIFTTKACKR